MATTIDQKVVEMRFDNRDFEKNTRQSMSTLEKLKAKLDFTGASKSLENVGASAKKVDMTGLSTGIETVRNKFSAMEIVGVTALVNITNSAIEAGKALMKSITVDPVSMGWSKMNSKIDYVQTLVNSTGKSVKEIDGYLNELMWFSDETSYSFTDMTAALAQMTSTGGQIEKLVPMITGIANSVAFAGKGAGEFSRAIYNLNQSYGAGALTLMDWKSLQNAGVNSKQLTEELIKAGEALGTLKKGQVTVGTFNDSLKDRWANTQVMEQAFSKFASVSAEVSKANKQGFYFKYDEQGDIIRQDYTTASKAIEDFGNGAALVMENVGKKYDELGLKAFRSAQEAKKFSEAMDATKDAVSSTWMTIFEDILGGYEEQKRIWTNFANFLYEKIVEPLQEIETKIKTAFNFRESDMGKMWTKLEQAQEKYTKSLDKINKATTKTSKSLQAYQKVVRKVWHGDYGNMAPRFKKLEKEGWDSRVVQTLVNKGVNYKLTLKDVEKAEKKYGITSKDTNKDLKEKQKLVDTLNNSIYNLTDAELKNLGMSDEEIKMYKELKKGADKYGLSLESLITKLKKANSHDLLFGKVKKYDKDVKKNGKVIHKKGDTVTDDEGNAVYEIEGTVQHLGEAITNVFKAVKKAWNSIFGEWTAVDLYFLTEKINAFSSKIRDLTNNTKLMNGFKNVLKGIFSILKLITTIIGGTFKIAWTVIKTVLKAVGVQFVEVSGEIGLAISKITLAISKVIKFITSSKVLQVLLEILAEVIHFIADKISDAVHYIKNWIKNNIQLSKSIDTLKNKIKGLAPALRKWWEGLKEAKKNGKVGEYLINSFKNAFDKIKNFLSNAGSKMLDWFAKAFSKSKNPFGKMLAGMKDAKKAGQLGKHIVAGLVEGITTYAPKIWSAIKWVANLVIETFKSIFKIHSPSLVMRGIGAFLIAGLIGGMKQNKMGLWKTISSIGSWIIEAFKTIGSKVLDALKNIDFGSAVIAALAGGFVVALVNISLAVKGLANAFSGFGDLMDALEGTVKAAKIKIYTSAFKDLAIAIAILAASLFALSKIEDMGKAAIGAGIIAGLLIVMGGIIAGLALLIKKKEIGGVDYKSVAAIALIVLAIGMVFKNIAKAVTSVANADLKSVDLLYGFLAGIASFIVMLLIMSKYKPTSVGKVAYLMGTIALVLMVMGKVIKDIGSMDPASAVMGITAMKAMMVSVYILLGTIALISKTKGAANAYKTLLSVAGILYSMGLVVKMLGRMKPEALKQGVSAVSVLVTLIVGLMAATNLLNKNPNSNGIGKCLLSVAGAILLMAIAVGLLGSMKIKNLAKGVAVVGAFAYLIKYMAGSLGSKYSSQIHKVGITMLGIGTAILIMSLAIALLGMLKVKALAKGIVAVGLMSYMMKILLEATKDAKNCSKTIWAMLGVMVALAGSIALLSIIEPRRLATATIALSAVMGMFILLVKSLKGLRSFNKKQMITIGIMAGIVLALAGILVALDKLKADNAAKNAVGLSILLAALVGSMYTLKKIGKINYKKLGTTIVGMLALLTVVAGAAAVLKLMGDTKNAVSNAIALSILMLALSGVLFILSTIGSINTKGMITGLVGLLALLGLCLIASSILYGMNGIQNGTKNALLLVGLMLGLSLVLVALTVVGLLISVTGGTIIAGMIALAALLGIILIEVIPVLKKMEGLKQAESSAKALFTLMKGLSILLAALAIFGPLALVGVVALEAFTAFLIKLGLVFLAIGFLVSKVPEIKTFVEAGIPIMVLLAEGLGQMIGAFVKGIASKILEILPVLGTQLSAFMENASGFIEGAKKADSSVLAGVGIITASVLMLVAAEIVSAIGNILSLGGFVALGLRLSEFAIALLPFLMIMSTIPQTTVKAVESLSKAIICLTAANLISGVSRFLGGSINFAAFGAELVILGFYLRMFMNQLGVFTDQQVSTANAAANIILAMANCADKMPKHGGLWQSLFGESESLSAFASNMPEVAKGVVGFINTLSGVKNFGNTQIKLAETAGKIITAMADVASKLPKEDGLWQSLFGSQSLKEFASDMPTVAKGVVDFITKLSNVENFGQTQIDLTNTACNIIQALSDVAKKLPPGEDNIWSRLFGSGTLKEFADQMKPTAQGIVDFIDVLSTANIDDDNSQRIVDSAVRLLTAFAELGQNSAIESLDDNVKSFGKNLPNFAKKLVSFINEMAKASVSTAEQAASNVTLIAGAIKSLLEVIKNTNSNESENIKASFEEVAKAGADGLYTDEVKTKIEEQAKNTIDGFIKGLTSSDMITKLKNAGITDAQAFQDGYKSIKGANINSPSKAAEKLGIYTSEGLYVGIMSYSDKLYQAGENVANDAKSGLSKAIAKISSMINSDMDTTPVIRPVLDISDVSDGIGQMNSMFNNPSIGLTANLNAIRTGMATKNQNGTTDDVITAIKDLSSSLGGRTGDTYNINGITYDDGSSISNAVETLIRAANIERRI